MLRLYYPILKWQLIWFIFKGISKKRCPCPKKPVNLNPQNFEQLHMTRVFEPLGDSQPCINRTREEKANEKNKRPSNSCQNCGDSDSACPATPFSLPAPDYVHSAHALYISGDSADAVGFGSRDLGSHDISKSWNKFSIAWRVIYPNDIGAFPDQP